MIRREFAASGAILVQPHPNLRSRSQTIAKHAPAITKTTPTADIWKSVEANPVTTNIIPTSRLPTYDRKRNSHQSETLIPAELKWHKRSWHQRRLKWPWLRASTSAMGTWKFVTSAPLSFRLFTNPYSRASWIDNRAIPLLINKMVTEFYQRWFYLRPLSSWRREKRNHRVAVIVHKTPGRRSKLILTAWDS